jgi:Flp pilus assembly protein TadD
MESGLIGPLGVLAVLHVEVGHRQGHALALILLQIMEGQFALALHLTSKAAQLRIVQ